ncbi:unnamed protein product [Cyclocybe aegerita]|uniref:Uncharacterized protein n=1 Tax=Cyclocybe aegerita TaxID=1973307 RepID=A0A8S0XQ94_CYCAE|nr:unnamed protein product [Cyclocybe aegerita]
MPHLPLSEAPLVNSIDLKANGEVSRMRSHKGNMPSLPQTKYCALCPAKFTRTTHLNRHLRSHTNERAHRCNICNAEFTRSDLLTRHKRTCGDASSVNRSRRKSCQACAESKVKCNLQQPCSKCTARGRECVFINDPEASRNKRNASKRARSLSTLSTSPSETEWSESSTGYDSFGPSSPSSTLSYMTHGHDAYSHIVSPSYPSTQLLPSTGYVSSASDCASSECSSRASPRLVYFDGRQDLSGSLGMELDTLDYNPELNDFFTNALDPFMEDQYAPCLPRTQSDMDLAGFFDSSQPSPTAYGNGDPLLYSQFFPQSTPDHDFASGPTNLSNTCSSKGAFSGRQFPTISPATQRTSAFGSSASENPTPEDLNMYLYLFFTEFNAQIPLFHRPSWKDVTHPILLRAMQACGALFAKNQSAQDFMIRTLSTSRDMLIMEFSKSTCTLKERMLLILAGILLQSIGLLSPRADQRSLFKAYHEVLVMMIRKINLIKIVGSWSLPDLSNTQALDTAWRDWARFETFKRALLVAFLQDCNHCIYYSTQPAFIPTEFDINLPCDDAVWRAQNARDWYQIQRAPSPYGTGALRLLGPNMQMAMSTLTEPTPPAIPYILNPFSNFVLINTILLDVFSSSPNPALGSLMTPTPASSSILNNGMPGSPGNSVLIQCALHNWQRLWSSCPEAAHCEKQGPSLTPFICSALSFYWLARFAEAGKQNGTMCVTGSLSARTDVEERHRVVKSWLDQINATLQSGSGVSPSPSLWTNSPPSLGTMAMPFSHV